MMHLQLHLTQKHVQYFRYIKNNEGKFIMNIMVKFIDSEVYMHCVLIILYCNNVNLCMSRSIQDFDTGI